MTTEEQKESMIAFLIEETGVEAESARFAPGEESGGMGVFIAAWSAGSLIVATPMALMACMRTRGEVVGKGGAGDHWTLSGKCAEWNEALEGSEAPANVLFVLDGGVVGVEVFDGSPYVAYSSELYSPGEQLLVDIMSGFAARIGH